MESKEEKKPIEAPIASIIPEKTNGKNTIIFFLSNIDWDTNQRRVMDVIAKAAEVKIPTSVI